MFFVDAVFSALRGTLRDEIAVVIVIDGDPDPTAIENAELIVAGNPDRVFALWRHNGGLSAARNTGITFSLEQFAALEAIYFLDADNTIETASLQRGLQLLRDNQGVDWIYPNLDMVGIAGGHEFSGPFSRLLLTRTNYCEAGSLVRRRVFQHGMRFDEDMRLGYEDWDFWLSAIEQGFSGRNEPAFGLRYLKRPESMLSNTRRDDVELRRKIERKHAVSFSPKALIAFEAAESPRFALVNIDTNKTSFFTDIRSQAAEFGSNDLASIIWTNVAAPNWQAMPPFLIFVGACAFEEAKRLGVFDWIVWELERRNNDNVSAAKLVRSKGDELSVVEAASERGFHFLMLSRNLLAFLLADEINFGTAETMLDAVDTVTLEVPLKFDVTSGDSVASATTELIERWAASPLRDLANRRWTWRQLPTQQRHIYYEYSRLFPRAPTFPRANLRGPAIGFVLPVAQFGGAERVTYSVAAQFKDAGWSVHLFLLGDLKAHLPREFADTFETIAFLPSPSWRASEHDYLGTPLPAWNFESGYEIAASAMAWLDAVVNCQSPHFHAVAGLLKRWDIATINHLHCADLTPLQRPVGAPFRGIAYEHAYDLILTCSKGLASELAALGVPPSKLLHVRNAPGYPLAPQVTEWVSSWRRKRRPDQKLRALFVGRLDLQKGVDRLANLIELTQDRIDWRVVGRTLVSDAALPEMVGNRVEPPTFDSDELTELYAWADVLVMLSSYEGVPLTILEAQRLGVVPLSTNVGAVDEIVEHEVDGVLIDFDEAVVQAEGWLRRLSENRDLLEALSKKAVSSSLGWDQTSRDLIMRVTQLSARAPRGFSH